MGSVQTDEDECTDHRAYLLDSPVLTRGLRFEEDLKFDAPDRRARGGAQVSLSTRLFKLASNNPVIQELTTSLIEKDVGSEV